MHLRNKLLLSQQKKFDYIYFHDVISIKYFIGDVSQTIHNGQKAQEFALFSFFFFGKKIHGER